MTTLNLTVDAKTLDLTFVEQVLNQALVASKLAALAVHRRVGERDACGFGWVSVYDVRSNSKLGKLLAKHGFSKAYNGGLQLWDPAGVPTQSISVKEAGAYAYATILQDLLGLKAYGSSRMD
jgi:hypothetical protein